MSPDRSLVVLWTAALPLVLATASFALPSAAPAVPPAISLAAASPATESSSQAAQEAPQPPEAPPASPDSEEKPKTKERLMLQEEIVVTANPLPTRADSVGSSVTVIGADEIERRGEPFVLDLLRTVPGLEVDQSGGPGSIASVFLRGANSNQTLVLIDGVRVTNTSGGFDFSGVAANGVERIEVLRGPQSTLYGSEAIGGVVSITSRRGRPGFHLDIDASDGSRNSRDIALAGDGATGAFDWSLGYAASKTNGWSAASEARGNTERDPFSDRTLTARVGGSLLGNGRVDLTVRSFDALSSLDGFTTVPVDDPNYTQDRRLSVASLDFAKPLASFWDLRIHAGANEERTEGKDPDTFFNNYLIRSRLSQLGVESDLHLGQADTLIVGASTERRHGENVGSYDQSLAVDSAYVQDEWSFRDRLFLTAGARHDSNSHFGDKTTYRVTGSALLPASWRLIGSLGTGFRAPSFDELFFPFFGNPRLRPENSVGADLGLERQLQTRFGALLAGVTLFDNRFRDLIDFDFTTSTFANIRRAEARGAEATLRAKPRNDLEVQLSYTYTDSEDRETGLQLARRPRNRWTLLAAFDPGGRLRGTVSVVAVDHRIDSDGTRMDNYQRVDLRVELRALPWLTPYLLLHNLLDQQYEEVTGYTTPRLTAFLGVRLRPFS